MQWWQIENRKGDDRGHPALTKWFHLVDSRLVMGPSQHDTQHEVETTKHNWSAQCHYQYNVTGWVSMWANDICYPSEAVL